MQALLDSVKANSRQAANAVTAQIEGAYGSIRDQFGQKIKLRSRTEVPQCADEQANTGPPIEKFADDAAPIVWMLGKTGAGKTSIIGTLTGSPHAEVGNGFVPCTRTAQLYDFPADAPLLRFLDTRGLGEAGYDPTEDLAWHRSQSHLMIVVMRVGDTEQESVAQVVKSVREKQPDWPILVVHTCLHEMYSGGANHPVVYPFDGTKNDMANPEIPKALRNTMAYQRKLLSGIKGKPPRFVAVDFTLPMESFEPHDYGRMALTEGVIDVAPEAVDLMIRLKWRKEQQAPAERKTLALLGRVLDKIASARAERAEVRAGQVKAAVREGLRTVLASRNGRKA